jgi:alcohol dehydrogenase (cytochrome c)
LAVAVITVATAASAVAAQASAPAAAPTPGGDSFAAWPSYNGNLGNTRATTATPINSRNVANLKVKWQFKLPGKPTFAGLMASNAIAVGKVTYLMDLNSNVYALNSDTGALLWEHDFNAPDIGPNGVTYRWGMVFGATYTGAFALDARTGALIWNHTIVTSNSMGAIDIAPQLDGQNVIVSTEPSTFSGGYVPGAMGIVWALNAFTGAPAWTFNTVKDGYLWGDPALNDGGGMWYPPAVDSEGRVFIGVGNPAPFPGTPQYPNGSSRPGPDLYTGSLVALDGATGKLLWYHQVVPHDLRDYDLEDSPIITTVPLHGVPTEVVIAGGKMGKAFAFRAADGQPLWTVSVGKHQNDTGPLPATPVAVMPGTLGGIETPMAVSRGVLYVPWIDLAANEESTENVPGLPDFAAGRGGLIAIDVATGRVLWTHPLPQMDVGGATVANDVVFTSTYDGTVYALDTRTGATLWTATTPAGINGSPAIDGDTLLVSAAATGFSANPTLGLVAYSLHS